MTWSTHARLWTILLPLYACSSEQSSNEGCATGDLGAPICQNKDPDPRPLVVGSSVLVYSEVGDVPPNGESFTYEVTSDAPDVVEVRESQVSSNCGQQTVPVLAKKAGTSIVHFKGPTAEKTVEVRVEDASRIGVAPFLDELASTVRTRDGISPPKRVDELAQVLGGAMRWRVQYFGASDQELRGRGAVTITPPAFASTTVLESREREVFELTGNAEGAGEIELRAGTASSKMPVRIVAQDAVRTLRLYVQDADADAGEQLNAMARAFDESQKPVYGAHIGYVVDGRDLGTGDYVTYERAGAEGTIETQLGDVRASTKVPVAGTRNAQMHSDKDLIDCSVGGRTDRFANFALVFGLVAWGLRRRAGVIQASDYQR